MTSPPRLHDTRSFRRLAVAFAGVAAMGTIGVVGASADVALATVPACDVTANADSYSTTEGTELVVPGPGVMANDLTPNCTIMFVVGPTSFPAHGTVTSFFNHGSFTYVPDAGFVGVDSFMYELSGSAIDSTDMQQTTVTITVSAAACVFTAIDDSYSTPVDTALTIGAPGVLGNDETCGGFADLVSNPSSGTLDLSTGGGFSYTPNPGFVGVDTFQYAIMSEPVDFRSSVLGFWGAAARPFPEGSADNIATVTITVTAPTPPPTTTTTTVTTLPPTTTTPGTTNPGVTTTVPPTVPPTTPAPTTAPATSVPTLPATR